MVTLPAAQRFWPYWPLLPLYPYGERITLCREVVPETIWTFDQPHGVLYAVVPIRMTIVRLATGGLLVYAPVAPTQECLALVQKLIDRHGEIRYIVLPTSSGLEHKVFVPAFCRRFPKAQLWTTPHQWSFPLNLPPSWLGFPLGRTYTLSHNPFSYPFGEEFTCALLEIDLGQGTFAEAALYHRPSHTLLVTDLVIAFPEDPPAIFDPDPYPLLFHARDRATDPMVDTPEHRRKGWQRIALFSAYFRPSPVNAASWAEVWQAARKAPDRSAKAYFGLYPFQWRSDWQASFQALYSNGQPLVAPILQQLILPLAPQQVKNWLDRVTQWDFKQILPCHLVAPIAAGAQELRSAFRFLTEGVPTLPIEDMEFVRELEAFLIEKGIARKPTTFLKRI